MNKKSLLIIGCSALKKNYEEPMPALYVYENMISRYLRRTLEGKDVSIDVYILSAGYGLISGWDLIEWYDWELTSERLQSIKKQVVLQLQDLLSSGLYKECFVALSRRYFDVIADVFLDSHVSVDLSLPDIDRYDQVVKWVEVRV